MLMTRNQKYAIATSLATSSLEATIAKLDCLDTDLRVAGIAFANSIDQHYRKRDGFIPRAVIRLINGRV